MVLVCDSIMMAVVQVLELEEEGKLNLTIKLKKRALQGAYDLALKKKKVGFSASQRSTSVKKNMGLLHSIAVSEQLTSHPCFYRAL